MPTLLLTTIFLPLAGALLDLASWPTAARRPCRQSALVTSLVTLVMAGRAADRTITPGDEPYAASAIPWLGARRRRSTSSSASGSTG